MAYDTFKHLILGDDALAPASKRSMDRAALSDAVASDPVGIGFVGLAYLRSAKGASLAALRRPKVRNGCSRIFRFRAGRTELDSRGLRDLDRLITLLRQVPDAKRSRLGFSDARGSLDQNSMRSRERSRKVADELAARAAHATFADAIGQEMPIRSNASKAGRERNRRVEVWLR